MRLIFFIYTFNKIIKLQVWSFLSKCLRILVFFHLNLVEFIRMHYFQQTALNISDLFFRIIYLILRIVFRILLFKFIDEVRQIELYARPDYLLITYEPDAVCFFKM